MNPFLLFSRGGKKRKEGKGGLSFQATWWGWGGRAGGSQSVENARCLLPGFPLGKGFEAKYNLIETWHIFIREHIIRA